jgi:hypothetical protein
MTLNHLLGNGWLIFPGPKAARIARKPVKGLAGRAFFGVLEEASLQATRRLLDCFPLQGEPALFVKIGSGRRWTVDTLITARYRFRLPLKGSVFEN